MDKNKTFKPAVRRAKPQQLNPISAIVLRDNEAKAKFDDAYQALVAAVMARMFPMIELHAEISATKARRHGTKQPSRRKGGTQ